MHPVAFVAKYKSKADHKLKAQFSPALLAFTKQSSKNLVFIDLHRMA